MNRIARAGDLGWRYRVLEPLLGRLAPSIGVALEKFQQRLLNLRAKDLMTHFQSCGEGTVIRGSLVVTDPRSVAVGRAVDICEDGRWSTAGGLTVGDRTRIGRGVIIETVDRAPGARHEALPRPVFIGADVWIGDGAVLLPGARLERGAVVAPGAAVSGVVRGDPTTSPGSADSGKGVFFVVSTGRSGSQTIARVLSQHPRILCYHEPRPQMIRLSTEFAHGEKSAADVETELRSVFCESSVFPADRRWGESDQKYWNLIPFLARLLPESRFVWLIRDGRDVVASMFGQDWFRDGARVGDPVSNEMIERWRYYRVDGTLCSAFSPGDWAVLSRFEKSCWNWQYVNERIETDMAALGPDRWRMVRLEELGSRAADLCRFLDVDPMALKVETHNRAPQTIRRWKQWSEAEHAAFERWCGAGMSRWYPGERGASRT